MSKSWLVQKERSNPYLIALIKWMAIHTSRWFVRIFLPFISLYFLISSPEVRKSSKYFLRRAGMSKVGVFQVYRHIHWFASTLLDRIYFLTNKYDLFDVSIHNAELIDEMLGSDKGCILLGSHLGSFEVMRFLAIKKKNLPLKIMMRKGHNEMVTRVLDSLDPAIASAVIDLESPNAIFEVQEALEQGICVGMLADRVVENNRMIRCNFLGDEAGFPGGPYLVASALQVPVILFYGLYRGANRYEIHFEKLSDRIVIDRKNRERDTSLVVGQYVRSLEKYVKLEPYNWFNFYDYWHDWS